jgi:CheY-like chemotaxis protein
MTRVLLVEDDPAVRDVVADFLELLGCAVNTAANGKQALDHVARARPDLILLDYLMPVMDGRAFGVAVRRETGQADVPIVLISGSPKADEVCDAIGATACLRKPFDMDELAEIVEALARQ